MTDGEDHLGLRFASQQTADTVYQTVGRFETVLDEFASRMGTPHFRLWTEREPAFTEQAVGLRLFAGPARRRDSRHFVAAIWITANAPYHASATHPEHETGMTEDAFREYMDRLGRSPDFEQLRHEIEALDTEGLVGVLRQGGPDAGLRANDVAVFVAAADLNSLYGATADTPVELTVELRPDLGEYSGAIKYEFLEAGGVFMQLCRRPEVAGSVLKIAVRPADVESAGFL